MLLFGLSKCLLITEVAKQYLYFVATEPLSVFKEIKVKIIPGVGFEPTRTIRPLDLKSNALTTRPSWFCCKQIKFTLKAFILSFL